jgi:predicted esterase
MTNEIPVTDMEKRESFDSARYAEHTMPASVKLYYDLHAPLPGPRPLLIALHGYGGNKRQMMREAMDIAPDEFAVLSLQGFHQHLKEPREKGGPLRFGFGWLTNFHPEESIELHHKAIRGLISELIEKKVAEPARIFLLGFSQSCALNFRFAFTFPDLLRGVIGICGGIPGDWATNPVYKNTDASVLFLHGTRDEFYPQEKIKDFQLMLAIRSKMVQTLSYDAGHEITPPMRVDMKRWLSRRARGQGVSDSET